MKRSLSMDFVWLRAIQEASAFNEGRMSLEHVFLGILKLPEMKGEQILKNHSRAAEFDHEADEVSEIFRAKGWNASELRQRLRSYLMGEKIPQNAESQINLVMGSAAYHAQKDRNADSVTAADVLGALLRHPSPMITALLEPNRSAVPRETGDAKTPDALTTQPEGIAFLPILANRVKNMRYALLNEVYGQNHVVQALSEGIFGAEALAASDEKRNAPRAAFVFAGPPGVGKTFMAERVASALALPFKRFDMSGYANHQSYMGLTGFAPSFKDAKPGLLTEFVEKHPHCLLLIDEVEKSAQTTLQLFLQILDGGHLHDDYTDRDADFRDAIIIFTTNAGRQLYDDGNIGRLSNLTRQSVLSALKTDLNPITGQPFFPPALCSRLSAGSVLMFNRLNASDLERICETELKRFSALFEKQYKIQIGFDRLFPVTLLLSEGVNADARTLRAQTELFCKNEIYRLCSLWGEERFEKAVAELRRIQFSVEMERLSKEVKDIFVNPEKPEMLVFGDPNLCQNMRENLPGFRILCASTEKDAYRLAGAGDPLFLLADVSYQDAGDGDVFEPLLEDDDWDEEKTVLLENDFDNPLITSFQETSLSEKKNRSLIAFLREFQERMPDVPVYLLESADFRINEDVMSTFSRIGVRGKFLIPSGEFGVFSEQMEQLSGQCYLQKIAASMGAEQRTLSFNTEPNFSQDCHTAIIQVTDVAVKRAANAEDIGDLLEAAERPDTRFDDVIGLEEAKEELQFFVEYLKKPRAFLSKGLKPPNGILLYGPPGTGKTLLARAMAGEANVAFLETAATDFVTKWQGSGPESIRVLFRKARRYAPSIVFIDEIDAIGRTRGNLQSGHGEEMALNALLTEMDSFRSNPRRPVFVLAATNFSVSRKNHDAPGSIDPALARRFNRKILVDLPNRDQRCEYLRRTLAPDSRVTENTLLRLANRSSGMSLADLYAVLDYAERIAVRNNRPVSDADMDEAYETMRHGNERNWGETYMERVAYHESGHALLCVLSGKTPSYLTITARDNHGGYMEYSGTENTPLYTKAEIFERIRIALGGRAAEVVRYGNQAGVSTGAGGDLANATELAFNVLLQYGMDDDFGLASMNRDDALKGPLAEKLLKRLNAILAKEMENAISQLHAHHAQLDALAQALLQKNKLTEDEITHLLGRTKNAP